VYFINHLDQAGLLDNSFNPYKGKDIVCKNGNIINKKESMVTDSPGFAPLYNDNGDEEYTFGDQRFAIVTGLCNEDYSVYSDFKDYQYYYHEGVDFRGDYGKTPIISLIHSKIIDFGWLEGYGRSIFLANQNGEGIYLLGHLAGTGDAFLGDPYVGKEFSPGEIVAYVGRSCYRGDDPNEKKKDIFFAPHLHVSYYAVRYDKDALYFLGDRTSILSINYNNEKGLIANNRYNPFRHNEMAIIDRKKEK
jgi:murein DD-endopeptidase MepM/ murein hydrolase activator NlpD